MRRTEHNDARTPGFVAMCIRSIPVAFAACLLCGPGVTFAQTDRATTTGTVTDATGAVLPGAEVVLTQAGTGTHVSAVTNQSGSYSIPGLAVGSYTLSITHPGFKAYQQTGIDLIATQVLRISVHLDAGGSDQTVTVTGGEPLLDAETADVSETLEQTAITDLPLNAFGGQDALNLMLAVTPGITGTNGTNQDFISFAGQQDFSSSVYLNGVESTVGLQGNLATPGRDALQEIQVITNSADAELATGSAELFQTKSGTNQFHGSAFEILQNEDLNANTWANKYFLAGCAPGNASCQRQYARPFNRFNDYGGTMGAPIWKNRAFIFGSYEYYSNTDDTLVPNSQTVPTARMLTGDFSELLTGGQKQGVIPGSSNPCTGQPYQYGQIFDPTTQRTINGVTCATPFAGNVIPAGRLSSTALNVAKIYAQDYAPTITTRIFNNFPTQLAGTSEAAGGSTPSQSKRSWDFRTDITLSDRQRFSGGFDRETWQGLGLNGGFNYTQGPFSSYWNQTLPSTTYQIIDTFSIHPNLVNTAAIEFGEQNNTQVPNIRTTDNASLGFNANSTTFPVLGFGSSNGIGVNGVSTNINGYYGFYGYHYQDTLYWTRNKHSIKVGGAFVARGMNANFGGNVQNYSFASDTGGPTDPRLTPFVGSGFATAMLGDVQSASEALVQANYPRQKSLSLFVQDAYKATAKLTLNAGLRWDVNLRGHEQSGRWQNFDLTANNPLWGNLRGAWVFAANSGQSFDQNQDFHEFGPRLGAVYQINPKLVGHASYGLFFVPISTLNSGFGSYFAANQNSLSFPVQQVLNSIPGSTAFNWDSGLPGTGVLGPQNSTNTSPGTVNTPQYIDPDFLHLGYVQNWYLGLQYEISPHSAVYVSYVADRGRNLQGSGRSDILNYPSFSAYQPLLLAGKLTSPVANAGAAAALGVPYPYAGFSGPAYAAIAPYPQIAKFGDTIRSYGNPAYSGVSAYDSLLVEYKARSARGLYADFSYDLSKRTGNLSSSNGNWGGNTQFIGQNPADWADSRHFLQPDDQRHLFKGYATYALPFGRDRQFFSRAPGLVNTFIGGWELGFYGAYGSGLPVGQVSSSFQLPYYFSTDRAIFAPGQSIYSLHNHFSGKLNLGNLNSASNTDFDRSQFLPTSAQNPFGNTPYNWNHWRWNSQPAQESLSATKHFALGSSDRYQASLSAQFFNLFNRHYYGGPDTGMNDTTFGQITSVSGNRIGQVSARIQW